MVLFSCFFFYKQKAANEMRISDWSSDVCSSDLGAHRRTRSAFGPGAAEDRRKGPAVRAFRRFDEHARGRLGGGDRQPLRPWRPCDGRSEESRVGNEWERTGRSRWSMWHSKKQTDITKHKSDLYILKHTNS